MDKDKDGSGSDNESILGIEQVRRHGNGNSNKPSAAMETVDVRADEIEADFDDLIPTPPDGGWGWVIVLSSFANHFILDGISYAFGSFMKEYEDYFKSSAAMTSALMSCLVGCYMLSGT